MRHILTTPVHTRRYCYWLAALSALTLLPVLLLNLLLGRYALDDAGKARAAFEWQRATHGYAYLPASGSDALFKLLQLNDRLPQVNGVVFGSSTAQPIASEMFPQPIRLYNFALHGHGLQSFIGEADYLLEHSGVNWLIIPLDWSIGFLYQDGAPVSANLSLDGINWNRQGNNAPVAARIIDALSYPRIKSLFAILGEIVSAKDKAGTFRQYFLQQSSDEYLCPDGVPARDFDTIRRGLCAGTRYDGSETFDNIDHVDNPQKLIAMALNSSSQYSINLAKTQGEPNPVYLQRLADLARRAEKKGGGVILFMPPLLAGMEAEFLRHPQRSHALLHTKDVLRDWASRENIVIFDAGQAERFSCPASEFTDQHHAIMRCYARVWKHFWSSVARVENGRVILPRGGMY